MPTQTGHGPFGRWRDGLRYVEPVEAEARRVAGADWGSAPGWYQPVIGGWKFVGAKHPADGGR